MKLECQRNLYSLDEKAIFLNGAYMSPMLKSVEQIGIENMLKKRNPAKFTSEDFFGWTEKLKNQFAELINTDDLQGIVPIGSASYGLSTVAYNIPLEKGDKICLLADQFPSNYYIWDRLSKSTGASIQILAAPNNEEGRGEKWNNTLLDTIDSRVKVVTMAHVHWADGTLFDLELIRNKCDEVGAYLIIDGTQSVGALPFDQNRIKADALICAGYKWLHGPYGIGVAYYGKKFSTGIPIEESWINRYNSHDFQNLVNYQSEYREGAQRYAVGESSNFILLPMLVRAIEQINNWTPIKFQGYCQSLTDILSDKIMNEGYWIENRRFRANHLFGVKIPSSLKMTRVKDSLQKENISVSYRGDFIRVSPSVYNTVEEVQKFTNCLSKLI